MELKDFVKKVITDLDKAVSEANSETDRKIIFKGVKEQKNAVEFDVAVTAESTGTTKGGGGIKVLGIGQAGVKGVSENKNSVVSRVSFSIDISELTKQEEIQQQREFDAQFNSPNRTSHI